jgi:hypothetical protein
MAKQGINSSAWNTLRNKVKKQWRDNDLPCGICGQEIDWQSSGRTPYGPSVDHIDSRMFGGETIVPMDQLRVVHTRCNSSRGSKERHAKNKVVTPKRGVKPKQPFFSGQGNTPNARILSKDPLKNKKEFEPENGMLANDPQLSKNVWISDWLNHGGSNESFVWPRLCSTIHPDAAGSLGVQAIEWINKRRELDKQVPKGQKTLRPWQEYCILRALEHDANGKLVWQTVLISSRRQAGKSVMLRELMLWRMHQSELFQEEQLILHTAQNLAVAREIQRPARLWAMDESYKVRLSHGNEEIEHPDGSRWMIRGSESVYGYSVSMGLVDEAWGVKPEVADDGLLPTMIERNSSQLYLVSTAHAESTELMTKNRREALEQMFEPRSTLILEWSAHPECEPFNEDSWREASPHWDEKIRDFISGKVESDGFRSQWLNIWAKSQEDKNNYLVPTELWEEAAIPDLAIPENAECVIAVDDYFGMGGALAVAWADETKNIYVTGQVFERMADVWAMAAEIGSTRLQSTILAGVTITADPNVAGMPIPVQGAGTRESRSSFALLRELISERQLKHADSNDLNTQIIDMIVNPAQAGGLTPAIQEQRRTDLVKVAGWAVQAIYRKSENTPVIY